MTYDEIRHAWNAQADDGNRWHSLSEGEKIEWAAIHAAAKERAARQAAQVEVAELKGRIASAGIERCRAVLEEREACAKVCDPKPGIRYSPNAQSVRQQCAAAIRDRQ